MKWITENIFSIIGCVTGIVGMVLNILSRIRRQKAIITFDTICSKYDFPHREAIFTILFRINNISEKPILLTDFQCMTSYQNQKSKVELTVFGEYSFEEYGDLSQQAVASKQIDNSRYILPIVVQPGKPLYLVAAKSVQLQRFHESNIHDFTIEYIRIKFGHKKYVFRDVAPMLVG